MTITAPQILFSGATSDSTANNVWTVTLTAGAAVGTRVIVIMACDGGDADPNNPTFNASDSKGNTWTVDQSPFRNGVTGGTIMGYQATTKLTTALVSGDTVSITEPTDTFGLTRRCIAVLALPGVDAGDEWIQYDPGSTSSPNTGATGTLSTSDQLVLAWFAGGVRAFTPGSGYTELFEIATAVGSADRQLVVEYKIVTSNAAVLANGTLSSSTTVIGYLQTWEGIPDAPTESTHSLFDGVDWVPMEPVLL